MKKTHQTTAASAAIDELVIPASVALAMAELAETVKEGLLALAVGAGFGVMEVMMQESVTALCGPKGVHDPDRSAVRHGREDGSVTLGGRRVPVRRPRVRSADGTSEVAVPAYEVFTSTDLLGAMALQRMMAKLSTRRYRAGLERCAPGGRPGQSCGCLTWSRPERPAIPPPIRPPGPTCAPSSPRPTRPCGRWPFATRWLPGPRRPRMPDRRYGAGRTPSPRPSPSTPGATAWSAACAARRPPWPLLRPRRPAVGARAGFGGPRPARPHRAQPVPGQARRWRYLPFRLAYV